MNDQYACNCINLTSNPIEEPPLEIVHQGNEAILNYYAQLAAQGKDFLYEAKMLIVGEGEAGKTTLAHKIPEPNCPLPHVDDRTRGISIQTHHFAYSRKNEPENSEPRTFHLNIWDFGGQEIYHYTHRFFLSKRSLYVLVADNRRDDTDFNYWLNIIELFAGDSPMIIVLNEKGETQCDLNFAELRSRYPGSIKEILSVNFKTQEEPDHSKAQQRLKAIRSLIGHIEHCAQNLPHIGEPVPARWVDVREAIEQDERNYIYRQQFDKICQAQDITASADIDTLLGYFHDLGILLNFAENPLLRDRVILNPTWATKAVYRIFDDDVLKAKTGRFTRQDCAAIWHEAQYRHMHDILIELMKYFQLVYEIDNTSNLVAPQLLPPNTPAYPWDEANNCHMQFRYDAFMPKGIFWQFAVTMYRYIPNHDWIWRNGMVIRRGNTWAEVKEDLQLRRISLRFRGPSIPEFRAVIIDQLDAISQSYHQLHYDKMIPCQCDECRDSNQPHFFTITDLKKRKEQRKKDTIECVKSVEDVPLSRLLEGYDVRQIVASLPDKQGAEPTPPPLPTNDLPSTYQISSPTRAMPDQIDTPTRIALTQTLSALPPPQFEELLFVLNLPYGTISSGAQKSRVSELLNWVGGTGGIGFQALFETLTALNIPFTPSATTSRQTPSVASSSPPAPAAAPPPTVTSAMQTIKIFLASSSELKTDREQFEIFINRQNSEYVKQGIFLELVIWENFLKSMSQTRSQDEYNQAIAECDIFVSLFHTKVGQYTEEEFLVALETFKDRDRPYIFTYFKDPAINMSSITPEIMTLLNFKQQLSDLGHFYQNYADANDLKHQFGEQLTKLLPKLKK
ncbi:MAG: COR domain-containing protein [Cyanobacteria bacterium P01_H01_bin.153]